MDLNLVFLIRSIFLYKVKLRIKSWNPSDVFL